MPVGPVVDKQSTTKSGAVVGWTPIYANYSAPKSSVVPAGEILPAKPKPVTLLARPFTAP